MEDKTDYSKLQKSELLKEYMLLKTDPLKFVFEMGDLFVFAEKDGKILEFSIQVKHLSDFENPWDCKVSNFALNKFFRTPKGLRGQKYKTLNLMLRAIEKGLLKKGINAKAKYYKIEFIPSKRY